MITNSPFIQLFMVVLAGAILFLYIMPTVETFRATEDQIAEYRVELERVKGVTALLNQHTTAIDTLPLEDVQALDTYLPVAVDEIAVMRDLQTIVESLDITLQTLEFTGEGSEDAGSSETAAMATPTGLEPVTFALAVNSTYDKAKELLRALEVNKYQLRVNEASLTPSEDGTVNLTLSLQTFALNPETTVSAGDADDLESVGEGEFSEE